MPELEEKQIRAASATARDVRRKYLNLVGHANIEERSRISAGQRRHPAGLLTGAGPDIDEFDNTRARNRTEMRQFLQKQKIAVAKRSSEVKEALHYGIEARRRATEYLASSRRKAVPDLGFRFVVIDTPLFILASQDINLSFQSRAPWNNVAKIEGEWDTPYPDNGFDDLSFIFVWENPADEPVVVNVESYLVLNGFCDVLAEAGRDPGTWGSHASTVGFTTELVVFEYWNNPPTTPSGQFGQFSAGPGIYADGGGLFGLGDYESLAVGGAYDVTYRMFLIPPKGVAVFEVALMIGHWTNGGYIEVDFGSRDFEIMCPALLMAVVG